MNRWLLIAVIQTTQSSWPPADLEPAVQEVAQPWEPRFVPRETVPETVRYPLSRKPTRLEQEAVGQQQHSTRVDYRGAHADAMSGSIKPAATTRLAEIKGQEPVGG